MLDGSYRVASKRKIIIDCDPGIDDALAIFMALASDELEVLGITTVAGNVNVAQVSANALSLVSLCGKKIPVCRGAAEPLIHTRNEGTRVHGANGVGDVGLPEPDFAEDSRLAIDFLREMLEINKNDLDIVAIGPLTNIAGVLLAFPDLAQSIRSIILMGGAVGLGNVTPAAEFNIFADPHAAAIVFRSSVPIIMYPLDVTNRASIGEPQMAELRDMKGEIPRLCYRMLARYADFYRGRGLVEIALHDPFAMACVIKENLATYKEYNVKVETSAGLTRGKTIADVGGITGNRANAKVAVDLDKEAFVSLMFELLASLK